MATKDTNSIFYIKAKQMLDDFVGNGGSVNELKKGDKIYNYIKDNNVFDEAGKKLTLEEKFDWLGHTRKAKKTNDIKQTLIDEIKAFKDAGGSFHETRKKLPFFPTLSTYVNSLKRKGLEITHDQAMKDLGYREYSDIYFRCKNIDAIELFQDQDGYVDSYRKDATMKAYMRDIATTFKIPTYLAVCLIADQKLRKCTIQLDYVEYVKNGLQQFIKTYDSLKGLKREAPEIYDAFSHLCNYYTDENGQRFTKKQWLYKFGMDHIPNDFKSVESHDIDIDKIIITLQETFGNKPFSSSDLDSITYRTLTRKASIDGVTVTKLLEKYGLNYNGISINRLAHTMVNKVPYLKEMKNRRDEIIQEKIGTNNTLCAEEKFEIKIQAVQQVYKEFQTKLEKYNPFTSIDENIEFAI